MASGYPPNIGTDIEDMSWYWWSLQRASDGWLKSFTQINCINFYDELKANKNAKRHQQYTVQKYYRFTVVLIDQNSIWYMHSSWDAFPACGSLFLVHSAKPVLRYLKKAHLFGQTYCANQTVATILQFAVYTDFAANKADRKSLSGFAATLNNWLLD